MGVGETVGEADGEAVGPEVFSQSTPSKVQVVEPLE